MGGEIDLAVGGFTDGNAWVDKVGLTRPYAEVEVAGTTEAHVMMVPMVLARREFLQAGHYQPLRDAVLDVLALWAVSTRISDFGFTPNRVAALGENVVLLGNLAGSAFLYARFLRGEVPFLRLIHWQTTYLYVLAGWAAVVAFLFPPLFGFR